MGYAAERFDSDDLNFYQEDNEFFLVCVEKDGQLCKYVTAARSRIDAIYNIEKETGFAANPDWVISGPMMIC